MSQDIYRKAERLREQGRFREALYLLSPAAAEARERDADLLDAIELTEMEAWLLGVTSDRDMALTRATWIVSVANVPANLERLSSHRGSRLVYLGYRRWVLCALKTERVRPEAVWPVVDQLEGFLRKAGQERWQWTVDELRAEVYADLHDHEAAVQHLTEAIEGFLRSRGGPGSTLASLRRALAWSLKALNRQQEAIEQLLKVVVAPDSSAFDVFGARVYLAQAYNNLEEWGEAARWADLAVEQSESLSGPQQVAAYGAAVEAWLGVDRLADAQRAAQRIQALALRSCSAGTLFNAAQDNLDVALRLGALDEAEGWIEQMKRQLERLEKVGVDPDRRERLALREQRLAAARGL